MTVHVDISPDDAALSSVIDLVRAGENVVLRQNGRDIATVHAMSVPNASKPRIGAWTHLGPFTDSYLDSWLEADPDFDTDKTLFPE